MSKINILPPEIFNRIAAGEVVERPASVVKELIENSIDSGATRVVVRVERAGTKSIIISDNGSGMEPEDALLCLKPHGTSKIKSVEDIDRIGTLGFRGEALPSIASVSNLQIRTRCNNENLGFEVVVSGGEVKHSGPTGCAVGTEMIVRDLFFNTPARRKFLRSFSTEESYIEEVVIATALANLNVAFEYVSDGKKVFFSGASLSLEPRLHDFFGKKFAENMLPVHANIGNIKVTGVVARPGLTRSSRRDQRSFVNGRPVESQAIFRGIRDGYSTLNERGRYSPCILFLHMPYSDFDINVHPAKRDVRFRQEYNVSRAVTSAIGAALKSSPTPGVTLEAAISLDAVLQGAEINYEVADHEQSLLSLYPNKDEYEPPTPKPAPKLVDVGHKIETPKAVQTQDVDISDLVVPVGAVVEEKIELPVEPTAVIEEPETSDSFSSIRRYIGGFDDTYLLFYNIKENSLEIMDQHAAHERVLYEQLLSQYESKVTVQPLLLPQMLEINRVAATWLSKNEELLGGLGFEIAGLSSNSIVLNAVPAILPESSWEEVLLDIYQAGRESATGDSRPLLNRIASAACHSAVKAHDKLTDLEIKALLNSLNGCERPDICPHGRPTTILITIKELEKRFGRR